MAVGGAVAHAEVEPGTEDGASVMKTGWWWAANKDATGETDVNPGQLPRPGVPEGALPVSAAGGEPEKVAAIEFLVDADPGATVTSFLLSLKESEEPGGSVNSDSAEVAVAACQITDSFWADGEGAAWDNQPEYGAEECVTGKRDDSGIWQFDLTSLASAWTVGESEVPMSVMLVPEAEAPQSFQAAFDGVDDGGIGVQAESEGGGLPGGGEATAPGGSDPVGSGDSGAADSGAPVAADAGSGSSGGSGDSGGVASGDEAPAAADSPKEGSGGDPAGADTELAASPAAEPPGLFDGIPLGVWFLIPVGLGLAYLLSLAMGPRGEQASGGVQHGVSRALERLRSAGAAVKGAS